MSFAFEVEDWVTLLGSPSGGVMSSGVITHGASRGASEGAGLGGGVAVRRGTGAVVND